MDVTSSAPPPDSAHLDYAPAPAWHRATRAKRAAMLAAFAGIIILAALGAPRAWRRIVIAHAQRECMNYQRPPTQPVLSVSAGDIMQPSLGSISSEVPAAWNRLYAAISPPGFRSQGTIFLHARRSAEGETRLIAADVVDAGGLLGRTVSIEVRVLQPGSLGRPPREIWSNYQNLLSFDAAPCRIYAGQADPADASHFTFRADANGQQHLFDGWLRQDDTVLVEPRPEER